MRKEALCFPLSSVVLLSFSNFSLWFWFGVFDARVQGSGGRELERWHGRGGGAGIGDGAGGVVAAGSLGSSGGSYA